MPELPEVETIRIGLQKYLIGKKIEKVEVRLHKIFTGDTSKIVGSKVIAIRRFGKALAIDFDNDLSLLMHVKMTGQLIYVGEDIPAGSNISPKAGTLPNPYTHAIFHLSTSSNTPTNTKNFLYYNDIRQFGWLKILPTSEVEKTKFIDELGPEPYKDLTLEKFKEILQGKNTAIKVLLMDQKKIGGIGNIYANDALFLAKINPKKPAKQLNDDEVEKLYTSVLLILEKALSLGGSSEQTFVNALGEEGEYQKHFLVYGKAGKKCVQCSNIIKKITLGGRGTFFCNVCQT